MTFTLDSSTDEGLLRVLIQDVDSTDYVFEDSYLTNILSLNSDDIWRAAADCCRSLSAKYAKDAYSISLGKGDISIDLKKKSEYFANLAKMYDSRSGSDVVEYWDAVNYNISGEGIDRTEYIGD